MKKLVILIVFYFAFNFVACNDLPPIEEKKLVKLYSEMIIIQDTTSLSASDIKLSVLRKNHIPESDYDKTIYYYNQSPEKWQAFFDSVIVFIERKNPNQVKPDSKVLPKRSVIPDKNKRLIKNP